MLKGLITAEAVKDKSDIFNVQMGDTHADIRRSTYPLRGYVDRLMSVMCMGGERGHLGRGQNTFSNVHSVLL